MHACGFISIQDSEGIPIFSWIAHVRSALFRHSGEIDPVEFREGPEVGGAQRCRIENLITNRPRFQMACCCSGAVEAVCLVLYLAFVVSFWLISWHFLSSFHKQEVSFADSYHGGLVWCISGLSGRGMLAFSPRFLPTISCPFSSSFKVIMSRGRRTTITSCW